MCSMTVLTAWFFSCHLSMSGIHLFLYFYRSIPVLVVHFCDYSFCIRICPVLLHLFVFEYVLASSIVLLISVRLSVSASAFNIFALVFTILFASVFIALAIYLFFFSHYPWSLLARWWGSYLMSWQREWNKANSIIFLQNSQTPLQRIPCTWKHRHSGNRLSAAPNK